MKRNSGRRYRNNVYYNVPLLNWFRENNDLTVHGTAVKMRMNRDTAIRVFDGRASQKQVWRVARFFKVNWSLLHDLELPPSEFHRAVLNGDSRSVR